MNKIHTERRLEKLINKETRQNHPTSEIIVENEKQLKQLQKWMVYGDEFFNSEDSERNITDLKNKLIPDTILVFNLREGQFEVISGREYLDDYFLFGTSQKLSKCSDEEIHQKLRSEFYSFTDKLKKMNLIISELDTNNIDYNSILAYHLELLDYRSFRKRVLVNLPLLEKLHQKINKDAEFKQSLDPSIITSINLTWALLNPNNKEDTRSKTAHKLIYELGDDKILKVEKGILSPDSSLSPNLTFLYTSELLNGDLIHHYKMNK